MPTAAAEVTAPTPAFIPNCKSAVLMEASTGKVLYAHNPAEAMPPASVTKIMTLLLVMERIDEGALKWEDTITASAHAASMGGSQIWLKEGETMTVEEYRKAACNAVRKLSADVGIPADLKEIVNPADLDFLSESAFADACRPGNPRETSVEEIKELYKKLL